MGWLDYLLTDDKKLKPKVCLMPNRTNFTHFHTHFTHFHELKFKASSTISVEIWH